MNEQAVQASRVVESVATALAHWVVLRHGEVDPDLAQRYGASWRDAWVPHVRAQIQFLVQAIAVRRPDLFAKATQWTGDALQFRQANQTDLKNNLQCLQEVLKSELPAGVADTATAYVGRALECVGEAKTTGDISAAECGPHHLRMLQYLEAVLSSDCHHAEQVALGALDDGLSVADVYEHVLLPAQVELGRMWHTGEISVADEHMGSATTQSVMALLRTKAPTPARVDHTVLATAVQGDLHDIGVRMVADFFDMSGWNVIYLGANTPHEDVVECARDRRPDVLAISTSTSLHVRAVGELIEHLRKDEQTADIKIIVGGFPFRLVPDLWQELGADGCAETAPEAVEITRKLVGQKS